MKIQFLWFNTDTQIGMNYGVSILSRELSEAGHEVRILHLNQDLGYPYDEARITADIRAFDPGMVALSFGSTHVDLALKALQFLRRDFPEKFLICGGVHCSLNPREMIAVPELDAVGIGECDTGYFVRFVEAFEKGDYFNVPSFWVRDGERLHQPPMAPLPDITHQTFLDFERIDYGPIIDAERGFCHVITGRGCPKRCKYCHNDGIVDIFNELNQPTEKVRFTRQRSVDNLLVELKEFIRRWPQIKAFSFGDDTLLTNKAWILEFADKYAREVNLPYACLAIAQQVTDTLVDALARSNCMLVKFGLESAVKRVRKEIIGRYESIDGCTKSIQRLRRAGINVRAYVMYGMPTETKEEMLETIRYCAENRIDTIRSSMLYPFPGTELYDIAVKHDLLEPGLHSYSFTSFSVLRWPPEMRLWIDKVQMRYAWILNSFLGSITKAIYDPLLRKTDAMSREEWEAPETQAWVWSTSQELSEGLRSDGTPHYLSPFRDRPESVFLIQRRERQFVNLDVVPEERQECVA